MAKQTRFNDEAAPGRVLDCLPIGVGFFAKTRGITTSGLLNAYFSSSRIPDSFSRYEQSKAFLLPPLMRVSVFAVVLVCLEII